MDFFIAKVKYGVLKDSGALKATPFNYIVRCESVTDAEVIMLEFLEGYQLLQVVSVRPAGIVEVINLNNNEAFYKARVSMPIADEVTGKMKQSIASSIISANNFDHAYSLIKEAYKDTTVDWDIVSISLENIVDVINN